MNTLGEVMEFGFMFDHSEILYTVVMYSYRVHIGIDRLSTTNSDQLLCSIAFWIFCQRKSL
jgi:hypothetical protein